MHHRKMKDCALHGLSARWLSMGLAILVLGFLSACQATPPQSSSSGVLDQFALSEIRIDYSTVEEPLREAVLEAQIRRGLSSGNALENLGTALGVANQGAVRQQLEAAISANLTPHMQDALAPLFRGTRPARAVVFVESVFIRSAASLQQLTGARVTVNGQPRPDNPQVIANVIIYDQETGLGIAESGSTRRVDDGTVVIAGGGPKAPDYGPSKRLNKLAFEVAQEAALRIRQDAGDDGSSWSGSGY